MSTPIASISQDKDDDGPEEGEIEDDEDEDDIILLGSSPQRSSSTSASIDIFPSPTTKESYERDIRRHELHRARAARIRRVSGGSKSPYGMGSSIRGNDIYSRTKSRHHRTGVTQGKENRHVHRHKSPLSIHHHRKGSNDRTLADFKDSSPFRRDSSCSSIDSEDRSSHHRSTHRRSTRLDRTKRKSSSSPDSVYVSSKRRSHSEKCPLIKVLHSVAKETRLIALETSESHSESSSLRQKLLNMGVMPALQQEEKSSSIGDSMQTVEKTGCKMVAVLDSKSTTVPDLSVDNISRKSEACNESTQTDSLCEEIVVVKQEPEVVILTDSEDGGCSGSRLPQECATSSSSENKSDLVSIASIPECNLPLALNPSISEKSTVDDDDDDISHLRLLALQSKKHEQTPPDDSDVLQLRLAALKTAFVKKFKTRKRIKNQACSINIEDPLSPLDEIPLPLSPPSPDEVMTPVDMELAETDDEANSVPDCYSPSDPTVSPLHDSSLQDLLPPPPPPDLQIDMYYADQNYESSFQCVNMENTMPSMNMFHLPAADPLIPPPLPPYFRELLAGMSNDAFFMPPSDLVHSHLAVDNDACISDNVPILQESPGQLEVHTPISGSEVNCESSKDETFDLRRMPVTEKPNSFEVPVASEDVSKCDKLVLSSSECVVQTSKSNVSSKNSDEETANVSIGSVLKTENNPLCEDDDLKAATTKATIVETPCKEFSLEEEEKMLRQRLLKNMANKRGKLLQNSPNVSRPPPVILKTQLPLRTVAKTSKCFKPTSNKPIELSAIKLKPISVSPLPPLNQPDGRFVIDLGEDSDSSGDYSGAEALGLKCAKNREIWLLHMKELEVNSTKLLSPGNKTKGSATGKLSPLTNNLKVKQASKERNVKKPFAENLADLESSVERFLKGVRSSHESLSRSGPGTPSVSASRTPVAVRHLPASQQEEYRRLKQQIAKLEKQRQISSKKQVPQTLSKGTQINSASSFSVGNSKQVVRNPNLIPVLPLKQSIVTCTATGRLDVRNVPEANDPLKLQSSLLSEPSAVTLQHSRVTAPQAKLNIVSSITRREVSVNRGNKALTNVSNLSMSDTILDSNTINKVQLPKLLKLEDSKVHRNPQGLATLESNLVTERSYVLTELSALAKLLSQVDKSLEAQSHTATEVASLLDKLCLAAGRWRAQNRTVTSLVSRVAQRQKDLSLRHRRCVVISKSCAELGNQLHGKNYRVPSGKADAMRFQLKQVHEKTQDLAKRRTTEQSRRGTLEKRAEHCLIKLFSDTKGNKGNTTKSSGQAMVTSSSVLKDEKSLKPSTGTNVSKCDPTRQGKLPDHEKMLSVSSEINNSISVTAETSSKIEDSAPQVNAALISRAVSFRMALNKVRSAKAILNFSKRKHIFEKRNKNVKRFCSNTRSEDQGRHELSDMDISTDGEEAERRNILGNTEVVDMSVSPDASSSPLHVEIGTSVSLLGSKSNRGIGQINLKPVDGTKPPIAESSNNESDTQGSKQKIERSSSVNKPGNNAHSLSKSVLKDYISPLGGLNVFSNSSRETALKGDLYAILCPYDLNGKCQDSECPFKHQQQEDQ